MHSLVLGNATLHWQDATDPAHNWKACVESWQSSASRCYPVYEVYHKPMMIAYQEIFENTAEDIIGYVHDDVSIYEPDWDLRVLREFDDPTVGAVGFFGALGHCYPFLYEVPFEVGNMTRIETRSNMRRDAERHGRRFAGECDVAVFDGFGIFVRRSVIEKWGGWPQGIPCSYWCYDYAISCEVRRQGLRNRLVGIDCDHWGGKSPSIIAEDAVAAHRWLYDNYRDVLPYYAEVR